MAGCASRLQGKIRFYKQVITDYHEEYMKLKNLLLKIGEIEGLTDEQWAIVGRKIIPDKLPRGHYVEFPQK